MGERTLEERLRDALVEEPTPHGFNVHFREMDADALDLKLSTALTLAERRGYALRARQGYTGESPDVLAAVALPLPTRTVRRLREEPDPHGLLNNGGVVMRYRVRDGSVMCEEVAGCWSTALPPAVKLRVELWHDLMLNPWSEEQAPVDPNEVLPP